MRKVLLLLYKYQHLDDDPPLDAMVDVVLHVKRLLCHSDM